MNTAPEEHFVGKVAQKVLLVKNGLVLITRDSRDTVWELPGGRLNAGENPTSGVVREVLEELGVEIEVGQTVYINQFEYSNDKTKALVIVYLARLIDETAEFRIDPIEVAQMEWVTVANWKGYEYYPEYRAALETYFQTV